jgi:methyl-accepting chemotaxis protein
MTLAQKLVAGFALPLVMLAIVAGLSFWNIAHLVGTLQMVAHTNKVVAQIETVLSTLKDAETGQRGYLLTDDKAYLKPYDDAQKRWEKEFTALQDMLSDPEQLSQLGKLKSNVQAKFEELAETITLRKEGKTNDGKDAALALVKENRGKQVMDDIRTITEAMRLREERLLKEREEAAQNNILLTRISIGAAAAVGLVLVSVAAFLLIRSIVSPIRAGINQLASASAEVLASTTQQATGAQEQAAAMTQTVATVNEVTQTADQSAQRARGVGDAVQRTFEIGKAGRKVVEDSVGALAVLRSQVEGTGENITALAEKAMNIGEIIATVGDIAEQTNLLALNAAIEASRAGEHGKGFTVVAGEVKALADQSKKATAQVRQMLGEIQKATNTAVMSTEEVTKGVTAASKVATQAGETIKALADTLAETAQSAAQIVASAGQQATGMAQIQQAMLNIDQVARQNLAATRQAEQAAQNLNALGLRFSEILGDKR